MSEIGVRLRQAVFPSTLNGIAGRTGYNARTIRRFLQGETVPPLEFLLVVAQEYKVSLEWLATGRGMMREEEYVRMLLATASIADLAAALQERLSNLKREAKKP